MESDATTLVVAGDEGVLTRLADRFDSPPSTVDVDALPASLAGVDCVVCDASPATDWTEALQRTHAHDPDLGFVLVAPEGDDSLAARALAAGVDDYLPAEVDDATLRDRVERVSARAREARYLKRPRQPTDGGVSPDDRGDLVLAERDLRAQNERLEEFASIVSHDLRNPLAVATGSLRLYRQTGSEDHLDRAADALTRMSDLLEELLTLAREGQTLGEVEPVSLETVARRAWNAVTVNGATLVIEADAAVVADPSRLQELLENLFSNAIEHGGADVTVRVVDVPDGFRVEDDGPGLPPEGADRVFEPGYTTHEGGTGFGLAIVDRIGEAHGWAVRVGEGDLGGACFVVEGVEFAEA